MKNGTALISFMLSPILGVIEAFKNLKSSQARKIVFLFCLCFGFCFSVGTQRTEGSADGISIRLEFEQYKNMSDAEFQNYISDYFEFDKGAQDVYIVVISYLVGKVTDNYHFFFLTLAFVFAFFQLKCLRYFVKEEDFSNSSTCIILACLFLWNNIYNINGARFWTASWIGLYCVFKIFYDKKYLYILLAMCLPMIHASFAVFPLIIVIAYLVKTYRVPLIVVFCISWAFSLVATDFQIISFENVDLPFAVSRKLDYYISQEYIEGMSQGTGFYWIDLLFKIIVRHYIDFLILFIALNEKNNHATPIIRFMLVLAIIANFGMCIPTFGRRFFMVNYALVAYAFLVTFGWKKYKKLVYALPFVWFMNLFYLCKDVMNVIDWWFVLPPFVSFVRYLYI